jgi:hypothetical protein
MVPPNYLFKFRGSESFPMSWEKLGKPACHLVSYCGHAGALFKQHCHCGHHLMAETTGVNETEMIQVGGHI